MMNRVDHSVYFAELRRKWIHGCLEHNVVTGLYDLVLIRIQSHFGRFLSIGNVGKPGLGNKDGMLHFCEKIKQIFSDFKKMEPPYKKSRKLFRCPETHPNGLNGIPWPLWGEVKAPYDTIYLDEVGMGCWLGPLYVCGVMINPGLDLTKGFHDSKLLKPHEREALAEYLFTCPHIFYHIEIVTNRQLDTLGGLGAAWQFACRAVLTTMVAKAEARGQFVAGAVMDGDKPIRDACMDNIVYLPKADQKIVGVSIASILAKESRDRYMTEIATCYPSPWKELITDGKGYRTRPEHDQLIAKGIYTDLHRHTYNPLKSVLAQGKGMKEVGPIKSL